MLAWIALPDPKGPGNADHRQARHLLCLPADVEVDEVETLAMSRFGGARWLVAPTAANPALPPPEVAAPGAPGVLRLSRHTTLTGPYAPGHGFPGGTAMVFDVVCPRERGDVPFPGSGDHDGINRAFPQGLPMREEERVVAWLIAACRRLGGSVRMDLTAIDTVPVTLTPDPAAAVDLYVYSDVWLEPNAALALVTGVHPHAKLATEGKPWEGPPAGIDEFPLFRGEQLDPELRKVIHAAAEEFDIAALSAGRVLEGYGILVDLGVDGLLSVEIGGEEKVPLLLRELPWTEGGAVTYRVHWEPPDLEDWQRERPSLGHKVARGRAATLIVMITLALQRAAGGEIADEYGFLLDPGDL